MKKFLILIMVLAMTLSLVACGGNNAAPTAAPSTPAQVEKTEFSAEQQALAEDFMSMAE
ncbi:hypothetical protein [Anaerotignum propionicum]|uniref:hypothetical protein n=1 Tax=Anaerotignum propionicum TaxID=28446 RepID=UPI00210ABD65|nr:hypothetical protein [Anaerotignum propionicum]MCQ4936395.1 hypothetical protein [Anaerotignum propionicum]